ncbi:DUF2513 domain-containing protein [Gimesia fumaroli]|uniref:DUF2513 domain-containing protein n=1 Tax=Gimesia fumaroli TaxID=2527976 RepID=A0A518I8Z0_9PLAN|nr:DUF2513 domain-containing protein [Gimesia fumaroli]QDV49571.1 hypothetical protein Enr17x_15910 [Gimesia fumaroli]
MKRNMNLIREILINLEADSLPDEDEPIGEWDGETAEYHKYLVLDAELAEGFETKTRAGNSVHLSRLTNKGHDFLEAAQSPTIWGKAIEKTKEIGGAISVDLMGDLLKNITKNQLGI